MSSELLVEVKDSVESQDQELTDSDGEEAIESQELLGSSFSEDFFMKGNLKDIKKTKRKKEK